MTEITPVSQELYDIKHLLLVVLKNQKQIQTHLYSDEDGKFWEPKPHETKQDKIKFEEHEAESYVNNVLLPKVRGEEVGVQGFWQGAALNYLKQQALNFIGHTLKKLAIEKAVDFSKWLMEEAKENIIRTYNNATDEEKETFKNKIKEVFPESPLLEELH
jgi:hypothetical protein